MWLYLYVISLLVVAQPGSAKLVFWANDGGDKVAQEDMPRYSKQQTDSAVWDSGSNWVSLFGARNEVVQFALVLESPLADTSNVKVQFSSLTLTHEGSAIASISTRARKTGESLSSYLFDWRGRNIEMFHMKYLKISTLSRLGYDVYDERHIPPKLQRPYTVKNGRAVTKTGSGWTDRWVGRVLV